VSLSDIIIRQGKVSFRHAQGAVSHAALQCEHVAAFAPELTRCVRLLALLDSLGGHSTAQWGDVRVQGGSKAPAAERRAELIEALESIPPKLVQVARKIRGNPVPTVRDYGTRYQNDDGTQIVPTGTFTEGLLRSILQANEGGTSRGCCGACRART